jgi:hypothetical protein
VALLVREHEGEDDGPLMWIIVVCGVPLWLCNNLLPLLTTLEVEEDCKGIHFVLACCCNMELYSDMWELRWVVTSSLSWW